MENEYDCATSPYYQDDPPQQRSAACYLFGNIGLGNRIARRLQQGKCVVSCPIAADESDNRKGRAERCAVDRRVGWDTRRIRQRSDPASGKWLPGSPELSRRFAGRKGSSLVRNRSSPL